MLKHSNFNVLVQCVYTHFDVRDLNTLSEAVNVLTDHNIDKLRSSLQPLEDNSR